MKMIMIAGVRPQFSKAAPVSEAFQERGAGETIDHAGQHCDFNMWDLLFRHLCLPRAVHNLGVGSGSYAWQTETGLVRPDDVLLKVKEMLQAAS